jgi:two-component system alkaline phosphatase synthesis response regulator PhoP
VSPNNVTGVIIADDDGMIRDILRTRLEALDLNVFLASNGLEAVDLASRIRAALIILDLKMPQLNGLLACERIRQLPGNAQTPIVVLTALPGQDAATAASRVGATAYFAKPFRPVLLLQELSRFLPINDAARDMIRHNADLARGIAQPPPRPIGRVNSASPGSGGQLERGKTILDVLRG